MGTYLDTLSGVTGASGLTAGERDELEALMEVWRGTRARNARLDAYFEGEVGVSNVGVDFLPEDADASLSRGITCDWAARAVKSFASLVKFDGFALADGSVDAGLDAALRRCDFKGSFARSRIGMLKKGCAFVTVNGESGRADVRFHSADSGAAIMSPATGWMRSGFVVSRYSRTRLSPAREVPSEVVLHMPGRRVVLSYDDATNRWHARGVETAGERPMMVPLVYAPTDTKPLGSTRITRQVRDCVDEVMRVRLALRLTTAHYAAPMKALLGLSDEAYDALSENPKWQNYMNPFLLSTKDDDGGVPQLVQLASNSPSALIELIREQARLFCGSTGIPLNSMGIVQDNPSSAEAIAEGRKDITDEAESLIEEQLKPAMREVALLAMAVESNRDPADLDDAQLTVMARFMNPAMPSMSARTDAAMKMASVDPDFAGTDAFYEMCGLDAETIARIQSQKRQQQARRGLAMLMGRREGQGEAERRGPTPPDGYVTDEG